MDTVRWMRRALGAGAALVSLLGAAPAPADDAQPAKSDWEFSLRASGFYGPISGFVQVPLGGNPGSSSARRPTLGELGIHDAAFWEVEGRIGWRRFAVFGGYTGLDIDGSATLDQSLVSHGVTFPAGTPVRSSYTFDVANLGAGYRFDFVDGRLSVFPKLDLGLLIFSSSLESATGSAKRAYNDGTVRLGADIGYQLGRGFAVELDGAASLPIAHMVQLADVTGRISYQLFPESPVHVAVFLGLGGRWIDFKDSQTLPNHVDVRSGPFGTAGFTLSY